MGVYDQGGRYIIKARPAAFFAWRAPQLWNQWSFVGWLDTRGLAFPGEPDRICDTVAEFISRADPRRRGLVNAELQAEPDSDMLERLGEYAFRLRRERRYGQGQAGKYLVLSLVLNLTGPEQERELDMAVEGWDEAGHKLRVAQGTLSREDAAQTLARIAAGELDRWVLPWLPLLHGAAEPANLMEWTRLAAQEPDDRSRSDFGALALVFAELAKTSDAWQTALKGWNMQQSQQVLEWQKEATTEANLNRTRTLLLRALGFQFGSPVPADLVTTISGLQDIDELDRWFDIAHTAPSLDAFRAAVGQ